MDDAIRINRTAGNMLVAPLIKIFSSRSPLTPATTGAAIPAIKNITATMIIVKS